MAGSVPFECRLEITDHGAFLCAESSSNVSLIDHSSFSLATCTGRLQLVPFCPPRLLPCFSTRRHAAGVACPTGAAGHATRAPSVPQETHNTRKLQRVPTPSVISVSPGQGHQQIPQWVQVFGYGFVDSDNLRCKFKAPNHEVVVHAAEVLYVSATGTAPTCALLRPMCGRGSASTALQCIVPTLGHQKAPKRGTETLLVFSTQRSRCHEPLPGKGILGTGESWNGKIWHNKSVPNYATVFEVRPHFSPCFF